MFMVVFLRGGWRAADRAPLVSRANPGFLTP